MFRYPMIFVALIVLTVACTRTERTDTTATETTAPEPPKPTEIADGLQTPESVLYDADQDVYFISNINGQPNAADDNGFISRVNAESLQSEVKWIDASKPDVTLNAPKGLAIVGDDLYVSDINTVRKFDRKTGAPKGEVAIKGSVFLNDLASDGATVYVSDTAVDAKFASTGKDAIYKIENNKVSKYASAKDLKGPNGLAVAGGRVWCVGFGGNELYSIENGKKTNTVTLPNGGLDGLVALPDGSLLVSSWNGKAIYRGQSAGPFQAIMENVDAPADIGYDSKRHRLLVPQFNANKVLFHDVQ